MAINIIENGGVTLAKGFAAANCAAAIKYKTGRPDMAMIFSKSPCVAAGTYTTNVVKAAPVKWDREITDGGKEVHAVVVNAGIANACTGEEGFSYCRQTAKTVEEVLNVPFEGVCVASTGVIGMQLPMDRVNNGVRMLSKALDESENAGHEAAKAIMTTDTVPKEAGASFVTSDGKEVLIGGMCKGSGMIHPNMCTMLGFITTDCAISHELLLKALRADIEDTFNMVSVDGDTSTNDSVILLANGEAGNKRIESEGEDYLLFKEALNHVTKTLAKKIAADGEGATALFEVNVKNCETKAKAKVLAKSVVCSSLTKAAIYGHDANWGRILCALGYSGAQFDPEKVDLYFESEAGSLKIIENGVACDYSEEFATKILSKPHVIAICDMKEGNEEATAWGCDLTHKYVDINADYRS